MMSRLILLIAVVAANAKHGTADDSSTDFAAELSKVVSFYRNHVGYRGAYLWKYAADFSDQEGEGKATKTSGWTQPPGTPYVGEAYLKAYRRTGAEYCLDGAVECAHALVAAQLESGGWNSHFDLGPEGKKRYRYRRNGNSKGRNRTTFDDNKSQSALTLLMHVDEELQFKDNDVHEAVEYALKKMLAAQYPNGAWPQQYETAPSASDYPVVAARFPDRWSREFPQEKYTGYYTLNDNNMSHIVEMMFEAHRIYRRPDCFEAAVKTGEFFLLAQLPEPQPGWAQQYNASMEPMWARKFEPPAVTGGESQAVMKTLQRLYRFTADSRFLKPLDTAIPYYRRSMLGDGRLARFYEFKTNRPLYFTKDYRLTYSDADMPTHYGFKVSSKLDSIEREYRKLQKLSKEKLYPKYERTRPRKPSSSELRRAKDAIANLDNRGAWVESGSLRDSDADVPVITMKKFVDNLDVLSRAVDADDKAGN